MEIHEAQYFGPAPDEPISRAAILLRNAMKEGPMEDSLRTLPESASEITDQLFVIAIRRRLARDTTPKSVEGFVREALGHRGAGSVNDGIAVVRFVVGAQRTYGDIDKRHLADLVIGLLSRMRTDGVIAGSDIDRLVVTAEARAIRMLRQRAAAANPFSKCFRPSWRSRILLLREYQRHPWPDAVDAVPQSIIGQKLRAIARFNFEKRDRLPPDTNDAGILEVVHAALSMIVRRRFSSTADAGAIADLAARVGLTARAKLDFAAIVDCITREVVDTQPGSHQLNADCLYIAIMVFAQLAEDLGMYDAELDAVLVEAERVAASRGYVPTPMPR